MGRPLLPVPAFQTQSPGTWNDGRQPFQRSKPSHLERGTIPASAPGVPASAPIGTGDVGQFPGGGRDQESATGRRASPAGSKSGMSSRAVDAGSANSDGPVSGSLSSASPVAKYSLAIVTSRAEVASSDVTRE